MEKGAVVNATKLAALPKKQLFSVSRWFPVCRKHLVRVREPSLVSVKRCWQLSHCCHGAELPGARPSPLVSPHQL